MGNHSIYLTLFAALLTSCQVNSRRIQEDRLAVPASRKIASVYPVCADVFADRRTVFVESLDSFDRLSDAELRAVAVGKLDPVRLLALIETIARRKRLPILPDRTYIPSEGALREVNTILAAITQRGSIRLKERDRLVAVIYRDWRASALSSESTEIQSRLRRVGDRYIANLVHATIASRGLLRTLDEIGLGPDPTIRNRFRLWRQGHRQSIELSVAALVDITVLATGSYLGAYFPRWTWIQRQALKPEILDVIATDGTDAAVRRLRERSPIALPSSLYYDVVARILNGAAVALVVGSVITTAYKTTEPADGQLALIQDLLRPERTAATVDDITTDLMKRWRSQDGLAMSDAEAIALQELVRQSFREAESSLISQ